MEESSFREQHTQKAMKLGFVESTRSWGNIFLTRMFVSLISKQRVAQRALCPSLAKHNMAVLSFFFSDSVLVKRGSI